MVKSVDWWLSIFLSGFSLLVAVLVLNTGREGIIDYADRSDRLIIFWLLMTKNFLGEWVPTNIDWKVFSSDCAARIFGGS